MRNWTIAQSNYAIYDDYMFGLGAGELILITVVVVFFFGAKKLPALGEAFGKSINSFKKGLKESDPENQNQEKPIDDKSDQS
jgi:sec-independent protein translocase protein TatA